MLKKYEAIFEKEKANEYPEIDAFERERGAAVGRHDLETAARVLACPLKINPPNWQHGRVLYAALADRLRCNDDGDWIVLDIGTAKGFSACVMSWALARFDTTKRRRIVSIDVVDPGSKIPRNSVAELGGYLTTFEFMAPFKHPEVEISLVGYGSRAWLGPNPLRIGFAFVDGKHTHEAVSYEAYKIESRQAKGDVILFDDIQLDPVGRAVKQIVGYSKQYIAAGPRRYCLAVKQ